MGNYTYYCEVKNRIREYPEGVYKVIAESGIVARWFPELNRIITVSDRVWKQGPRGGVKIIKEPFWSKHHYGHKYLTSNPDAMREFAWIKLKAKEIL